MDKITHNLQFLENQTNSHLHVDLIIGLPGESVQSFADNLNKLTTLTSSEIQIGILKKLSGTTISRHDEVHKMTYSSYPPYEILANDCIDFGSMQRLKRFSRYWDIVYNSGNFYNSVRMLWKDGDTYQGFMAFTEWIYSQTSATWKIALQRMAELLFRYLTEEMNVQPSLAADTIADDIQKVRGRRLPPLLREHISGRRIASGKKIKSPGKRQTKHVA